MGWEPIHVPYILCIPVCMYCQSDLNGSTICKTLFMIIAAARKLEDDEYSQVSQLSDSMISVISSTSSLASEVLERAAQRQKFWKK